MTPIPLHACVCFDCRRTTEETVLHMGELLALWCEDCAPGAPASIADDDVRVECEDCGEVWTLHERNDCAVWWCESCVRRESRRASGW